MPEPLPLRFSAADQARAYDSWGSNCGPGAIAGVLGLTLDELRPFLGDFEAKRYTNPTLMWGTLNELRVEWQLAKPPLTWPAYGLARIQWQGPWTERGVSPRAAYRHTHWVGACVRAPGDVGIFDINCMESGGWVALADWSDKVVPWLLKETTPRASGRWHITHAVEILTIDRMRLALA